jgi:hypothetical protein
MNNSTFNPSKTDAVLGGNNPLTTSAVLGGQEKYLARLFDLFNAEAKLCNVDYYRLAISEEVALVGRVRRSPLEDLKIKALKKQSLIHEGKPYIHTFWEFAGYLKHGGSLFTPATASYDPAKCDRELRAIAYQALIKKAREVGGAQE